MPATLTSPADPQNPYIPIDLRLPDPSPRRSLASSSSSGQRRPSPWPLPTLLLRASCACGGPPALDHPAARAHGPPAARRGRGGALTRRRPASSHSAGLRDAAPTRSHHPAAPTADHRRSLLAHALPQTRAMAQQRLHSSTSPVAHVALSHFTSSFFHQLNIQPPIHCICSYIRY